MRARAGGGVVQYNLACHYALAGETETAIKKLREALELNPELAEWSKEDSDLASIREEPGYIEEANHGH
jgi:tetratricopeptide (TPR) repeat protein